MKLKELIAQQGQRIEKAKGEHVFMQGEKSRSFYYVESGLLKAYYVSGEGQEYIKSFLLPGGFIGSISAMFDDGSASFSLVCLAPSTLHAISFETLKQHSANDLELANRLIDLLIQLAMKKERREYEFLCLSAEERFRLLQDSEPSLLDKVTQNDLARYLGITPVGLSRIKKRVNNPQV